MPKPLKLSDPQQRYLVRWNVGLRPELCNGRWTFEGEHGRERVSIGTVNSLIRLGLMKSRTGFMAGVLYGEAELTAKGRRKADQLEQQGVRAYAEWK